MNSTYWNRTEPPSVDNQPMKIGRAQSRLGGRVGLTSNTKHVVVRVSTQTSDNLLPGCCAAERATWHRKVIRNETGS